MNRNCEHNESCATTSSEVVECIVVTTKVGRLAFFNADQSFTKEQQAELEKCVSVIADYSKNVPMVARAIATIERESYHTYYKDGIYKSSNDFLQKIFGLERTYIFRMKKYGKLLFDENIPEGREPSETALREILKECYSEKDRKKIYHDAQVICYQRVNKLPECNSVLNTNTTASSEANVISSDDVQNSENACVEVDAETLKQYVPEAKDFRDALKKFKKVSDKIFFPQLDNKAYPIGTTFAAILQDNTEKIKSVRTILTSFQYYKQATKMTVVDAETANCIRTHVTTLLKEATEEMEQLLQNP